VAAIQREAHPFVSKAIDLFGDWLKQRQQSRGLTGYEVDPVELDRIAREFGMTPANLHMLVRQGPNSADELQKMLRSLGIDQEAIWWAEPALLRDMERVCPFCEHKRQCCHELEAGTAPANYEEYCANADSIDVLRFKS
jgi:hypothetical protein